MIRNAHYRLLEATVKDETTGRNSRTLGEAHGVGPGEYGVRMTLSAPRLKHASLPEVQMKAREVCTSVQPSSGLSTYSQVMISCAYCGKPSTMTIVSNPHHVCLDHALEFWTGFLGCAVHPLEPCVKHEGTCSCGACEEASAASRRVTAIAAAGPSPRNDDRFVMSLAS